MKKYIQLKQVAWPQEVVVLDTEVGAFAVSPSLGTSGVQGNYMLVAGQKFGVFASDGGLYFQWNSKRWNIYGLEARMRYEHDFQRGTTTFSVDDESIQYPAWWVGDSTFDPSLPERDEDEDFLAYVASLARNANLQLALIQGWDK